MLEELWAAPGSPTWSARLTPKLSCLHRELSEDTEPPRVIKQVPLVGQSSAPCTPAHRDCAAFSGKPRLGTFCRSRGWPCIPCCCWKDLLTSRSCFYPQQRCGQFLKCLNHLACPNPAWPSHGWRWAQGQYRSRTMKFLLPACRICQSPPLPSSVECSSLFFPPLSTIHITITLRGLVVLLSLWCFPAHQDSPLALQHRSFASSILSLEASDPLLQLSQPWEKLFLLCWTHP